MARKGKLLEAIGYMRTSSATNVGPDKDSEARQRKAIEGYAKSAGMVIVEWFYDAAVRGADTITERPGFAVLAPEDMVLHSATHLFNEGEFDRGLRDLNDLDLLLREFGAAAELRPRLGFGFAGKDCYRPPDEINPRALRLPAFDHNADRNARERCIGAQLAASR